MKRASDVPLHKLDEKSTMRNEEDDDPRASEGDESRYGPPVEVGYGIKKADAATLVSAAAHPAPPLQLPATGAASPNSPAPLTPPPILATPLGQEHIPPSSAHGAHAADLALLQNDARPDQRGAARRLRLHHFDRKRSLSRQRRYDAAQAGSVKNV